MCSHTLAQMFKPGSRADPNKGLHDCMAQIVEGIALIISSLPEEQRRQGLASLLQPLVVTAQRALAEQTVAVGQEGSQRQRQALVLAFDRMTVVFKCGCWRMSNCPSRDAMKMWAGPKAVQK